jgi:hypothetical protein
LFYVQSILVRSHLTHLSSNITKEPLSPNDIFFSIQQRIEAYKPKLNWNDMDHHVRLIAKDLHRTDFISSKTKPDEYNYGPLTRLLITFACYNPHIGYSQGILFHLTKDFELNSINRNE